MFRPMPSTLVRPKPSKQICQTPSVKSNAAGIRSRKMLTHEQLRAKALGHAEVRARFEESGEEYLLLDEFLRASATEG